jgi:hypothetical protein
VDAIQVTLQQASRGWWTGAHLFDARQRAKACRAPNNRRSGESKIQVARGFQMKGEDNRTYTRREVVGGMGLGITALSTGAVAAGLGGDAAAASVAPARRHRPDLRFRHRRGLSTLF